jgi:hypothetical protein
MAADTTEVAGVLVMVEAITWVGAMVTVLVTGEVTAPCGNNHHRVRPWMISGGLTP